MRKRQKFPTPIQNIALDLAFAAVGEDRINRTQEEYAAIAAKLPPLKQLDYIVNKNLGEMHRCSGCNGEFLPQLLRFKARTRRIVYEPYPATISRETLRAALTVSGMRPSRKRRQS